MTDQSLYLQELRYLSRIVFSDSIEKIGGDEVETGGGCYIIPENSHQPTRRRERIMKRFKSPRQVQRFLSIHDQVANVFTCRPSQDTATKFQSGRNQAFTTWAEVTGVAMAA